MKRIYITSILAFLLFPILAFAGGKSSVDTCLPGETYEPGYGCTYHVESEVLSRIQSFDNGKYVLMTSTSGQQAYGKSLGYLPENSDGSISSTTPISPCKTYTPTATEQLQIDTLNTLDPYLSEDFRYPKGSQYVVYVSPKNIVSGREYSEHIVCTIGTLVSVELVKDLYKKHLDFQDADYKKLTTLQKIDLLKGYRSYISSNFELGKIESLTQEETDLLAVVTRAYTLNKIDTEMKKLQTLSKRKR